MRFTMGRDMGIVMAKGVVIGIACVILILPCLILVFDEATRNTSIKSLFPDFTNFNRFLLKHRRFWIILFLFALVPAYYSQKTPRSIIRFPALCPRISPRSGRTRS